MIFHCFLTSLIFWLCSDWDLARQILLGVVSLMFRELSKIISRKCIKQEITFVVRILNWNFVGVPKAWLWAHVQNFSWISHNKYNFCNTQISEEYFWELAKCSVNCVRVNLELWHVWLMLATFFYCQCFIDSRVFGFTLNTLGNYVLVLVPRIGSCVHSAMKIVMQGRSGVTSNFVILSWNVRIFSSWLAHGGLNKMIDHW